MRSAAGNLALGMVCEPSNHRLTVNNSIGDRFRLPYSLEIRPSQEFNYEAGKNKIINNPLLRATGSHLAFITPVGAETDEGSAHWDEADYTSNQGKLLRLSTKFDIESRLTIGCAGAVITFLQRRKAIENLPGDFDTSSAFRVSAIEVFSLSGIM